MFRMARIFFWRICRNLSFGKVIILPPAWFRDTGLQLLHDQTGMPPTGPKLADYAARTPPEPTVAHGLGPNSQPPLLGLPGTGCPAVVLENPHRWVRPCLEMHPAPTPSRTAGYWWSRTNG